MRSVWEWIKRVLMGIGRFASATVRNIILDPLRGVFINKPTLTVEASEQSASWATRVDSTTSGGGELTKSAGGASWATGYAYSSSEATSGDTYVQGKAASVSRNCNLGLANEITSFTNSYELIKFGVGFGGDGKYYPCENGVFGTFIGTYLTSDVISVERSGSTVVMKKNGTTVHTFSGSASGSYFPFASVYEQAQGLTEAQVYY